MCGVFGDRDKTVPLQKIRAFYKTDEKLHNKVSSSNVADLVVQLIYY
jgi:hypothetical protein